MEMEKLCCSSRAYVRRASRETTITRRKKKKIITKGLRLYTKGAKAIRTNGTLDGRGRGHRPAAPSLDTP